MKVNRDGLIDHEIKRLKDSTGMEKKDIFEPDAVELQAEGH